METVKGKHYDNHFENQVPISVNRNEIFAFVDDHKNLATHMNKSTWMMGGGHMRTEVDSGQGQKVGSHIRMAGKVFGGQVSLEEVITEYAPPQLKVWETVGQPKLIVIGHYRRRTELEPQMDGTKMTVSIDYNSPQRNAWLGFLFGNLYAKWCVNKMLDDIKEHFRKKHPSSK